MVTEVIELKVRTVSRTPCVFMAHLDYGLSPSRPLVIQHRDGPTAPLTFLNTHGTLEIGMILLGHEERIFGDLTLPVSAGDVWLVPMWEMHGTRPLGSPAHVLTVNLLPEFLGEARLGESSWLDLFAVPPSQRPRVTDQHTRLQVIEIGREIQREHERHAFGWQEAVRLDVLRLLLALRRIWRPPGASGLTTGSTSSLQRVMPVLSIGEVDPRASISLEQAADLCGLSRRHFTRIFRQAMGVSFHDFRRQARVTAASHLLLTTDLGVEAIAQQTGFTDASHLHRAFVSHYACTPAQYRRRQGGASSEAHGELH
jgi:AraC-like DNA-binding protein